MKRKNVRNLLLWIVIPAVTSFLAGVWFTLHGFTSRVTIIWLVIMFICPIDACVRRDLGTGFLVMLWWLEPFTGFLYVKVLAGFLGEFGIKMHLFCNTSLFNNGVALYRLWRISYANRMHRSKARR